VNLDLEQLRSFAAVVDYGGFTRAAEVLHKTQSTISAQLKRLEETSGCSLLDRNTRNVRLTPHGELVLAQARELFRINDNLLSRLHEPALEGTVRLGTPEDFATTYLPRVLAEFARTHARVQLEVSCELTRHLLSRFRDGEFDLVLIKQEPRVRSRGIRVWREPLVWVAGARDLLEGRDHVPLVVSPQPCVYRARAISALKAIRRPWHIVYQSPSLAGACAAVRAELGVTILPKEMVPAGFEVIGEAQGLPALPDTEMALKLRSRQPAAPVRRLADHIVHALETARPWD
jgi:DNA-binding transcriptional LysR family regulator